MNVSEAVRSRFTVRAFLEKPVPAETVREILATARQAPSGGNLQPWHVHVLSGAPLREFKALIQRRLQDLPDGEGTEYRIYPANLGEPYRGRRYQCGMDLYTSLGIAREDKAARRRQFVMNFDFFGAPVGMFFCIDRQMGPPQWADLGMYLQTVMLLAREYDLHTCPQESWARWHRTVGEFIGLPEELMLFCGMALGYADEDAPVNRFRTARAGLDEFAVFHGF